MLENGDAGCTPHSASLRGGPLGGPPGQGAHLQQTGGLGSAGKPGPGHGEGPRILCPGGRREPGLGPEHTPGIQGTLPDAEPATKRAMCFPWARAPAELTAVGGFQT